MSCVGVRPELDETGPFLRAPRTTLGPPNYVLTKTHCGGYCTNCGPDRFVRSLNRFESGCTRSYYCHAKNENRKDTRRYRVEDVSSAVHLIRNPFDNLVARSHKGVQKLKQSGDWTDEEVVISLEVSENSTNAAKRTRTPQEVFANWCSFIDSFAENSPAQRQLLGMQDDMLWNLFSQLPCRFEWYRYVHVLILPFSLENPSNLLVGRLSETS
jgi:hypothetical protein